MGKTILTAGEFARCLAINDPPVYHQIQLESHAITLTQIIINFFLLNMVFCAHKINIFISHYKLFLIPS